MSNRLVTLVSDRCGLPRNFCHKVIFQYNYWFQSQFAHPSDNPNETVTYLGIANTSSGQITLGFADRDTPARQIALFAEQFDLPYQEVKPVLEHYRDILIDEVIRNGRSSIFGVGALSVSKSGHLVFRTSRAINAKSRVDPWFRRKVDRRLAELRG